jgi:sugar lactone lactonase YvrE
MTMIKTTRYLFIILFVSFFFLTCRKKDKDDECPVCPSVESISPTSARAYDKLTIFGKNFSVTPSANIVKINGTRVSPDSIISGTADKLVVRVPRGCGSGEVTVDLDDELTNFGTPPVLNYIFRYAFQDFGSIPGFEARPPACISGQASGSASNYNHPMGIVTDATGNIFFSDFGNHAIYKMDAINNHDSCLFAGMPQQDGHWDALGSMANFSSPNQLYIDNNNTIFVAEKAGIRTISPSGNTSTFITDTNLTDPTGIAFQPGNPNLAYVSGGSDHTIIKIERQGTKLVSSIFAGKKKQRGYVDATGSAARFIHPEAIVVDNAGNVFVSDSSNVIRKITPGGVVTTFAGNGSPQFADGMGKLAAFNQPMGLFIDTDNTIYVADSKNNAIRQISPNGNVTTFFTFTGLMSTPIPYGVTKDKNANFFITNRHNFGNGIKKLTKF